MAVGASRQRELINRQTWRREGCPPLPHHLVCVEKFPYLTLPSVPSCLCVAKQRERERPPIRMVACRHPGKGTHAHSLSLFGRFTNATVTEMSPLLRSESSRGMNISTHLNPISTRSVQPAADAGLPPPADPPALPLAPALASEDFAPEDASFHFGPSGPAAAATCFCVALSSSARGVAPGTCPGRVMEV